MPTPTTKAAVTALMPARKRPTPAGSPRPRYTLMTPGPAMAHAPRTSEKVKACPAAPAYCELTSEMFSSAEPPSPL
jgi:hypothetical protein